MSERLKNIGKVALVSFLVYEASNSAFTHRSRKEIKKRDGGRCVNCGSTEHLECAHIDHDRSNPKYNDPSNGRLLCTDDHLDDHIKRHGRNGLTKEQNKWAIRAIKKRANERKS